LGFILVIINIFPVLGNINIYFPQKESDMKICQINILTQNKRYEKVRQELLKNAPDIIVVEEIDDTWSSELYTVKNEYPYTYEVSGEGNFGIAVYSKIPIIKIKKMYAGNLSIPLISAICKYKGNEFEVIAIHTTPPISQEYFQNTRQMLENVSSYIESTKRATIVVGDINSSFFSYNYKNFIKNAGLKPSGSILKPTWAAFHPFFMRISLDHIFVTKEFGINSFKIGKNIGSDHFPVYAEIYLSK
ncbi:MAG: endonuclease/exonuclease/phosphatase family protein, partial [Candidatus Gastranaerophilaceae bacterium]